MTSVPFNNFRMSGNVIDLCPVGGLTSKEYNFDLSVGRKSAAHQEGNAVCGCSSKTRNDGVFTRFEPWMVNEDSSSAIKSSQAPSN